MEPTESHRYLKSKQYYIDLYDRQTVELGREKEKNLKRFLKEDGNEVEKRMHKLLHDVATYFQMVYFTTERWEEKEKTVSEWMGRDRERDELLNTATAPEGIHCLTCRSKLVSSSKLLHNIEDGKEKVLFLYTCKNKCLPRRMFFHTGEEYRPKPDLCAKCNSTAHRTHERVENIVTITETCSKCGNVDKTELDLGIKEEMPDPDFSKDRERFCITDEQAEKNKSEIWDHERLGKFDEERKQREKEEEEDKKIAQIKKLTLVEVEKILIPVLEEHGYIRFCLETPIIDRDVYVPFTLQDIKGERRDRTGALEVNKIIRKVLAPTNWRLMSDGVMDRLGILSGRLRGYEQREDLLELARLSEKKAYRHR